MITMGKNGIHILKKPFISTVKYNHMTTTVTRSPPYLGSVSSLGCLDVPAVLPARQLGAWAWLVLKLTNQKPARRITWAGLWLVNCNGCGEYSGRIETPKVGDWAYSLLRPKKCFPQSKQESSHFLVELRPASAITRNEYLLKYSNGCLFHNFASLKWPGKCLLMRESMKQ